MTRVVGRWALAAMGALALGIIGTAVTSWSRLARLEDRVAVAEAAAAQARADTRDHAIANALAEAEWRAAVLQQALTVRGLETESAAIRRNLDELSPLLRARR